MGRRGSKKKRWKVSEGNSGIESGRGVIGGENRSVSVVEMEVELKVEGWRVSGEVRVELMVEEVEVDMYR